MDTISWGQWTTAWPEVITRENTFPAPGTLDQILPMGQRAKEARGKDFIQNPCLHYQRKKEFGAAFLAFSSQIHPRYTLKVKFILLLGHLPSEIYLIIPNSKVKLIRPYWSNVHKTLSAWPLNALSRMSSFWNQPPYSSRESETCSFSHKTSASCGWTTLMTFEGHVLSIKRDSLEDIWLSLKILLEILCSQKTLIT